MISSISSDSSYLTLQTNNSLLKKLAAAKEADKNTAVYSDLSSQTNELSSNSDSKVLSIEALMGMMQTSQNSTRIPLAAKEETSSTENVLGTIDADGDGTLSATEYDAMISQMGIDDAASSEDFFAQFDTDANGEITSAEMDANKPMGPPPAGMPPEDDAQTIISGLDTDGDGTISVSEYEAAVTAAGLSDAPTSKDLFAQFDTDSDGKITADELLSAQIASAANQTEKFKSLAADTLSAYETNYQYMYESDNSTLSSIA
ncbi:MAG: EF-hand domain-containing protein [Mobilitalea sp.]